MHAWPTGKVNGDRDVHCHYYTTVVLCVVALSASTCVYSMIRSRTSWRSTLHGIVCASACVAYTNEPRDLELSIERYLLYNK